MKLLIPLISQIAFANYADQMQKELNSLKVFKEQDIVILTAEKQDIENQQQVSKQQDIQVKDLFDEVGTINAKSLEPTQEIQQSAKSSRLIRKR